MKFKLLILGSVVSLFCSCSSIQRFARQEIKTNISCADIIFEEKMPLVVLDVDKIQRRFLFDTGATTSCITDSIVIQTLSNKEFTTLGSATGADGKKIKSKLYVSDMQSELFASENKVLTFIDMPANKCNSRRSRFSGILGMDVFFDKHLSMKMDFTNNKVCNITTDQIHTLLQQEPYNMVKSKFKYKQIYVFLTIEGKEYKFKLDTGFTGSITMPIKNASFQSKQKTELVGSFYLTITSFTDGNETLYEKIPMTFGIENLEAKINLSGTIVGQNIGIEFMKGFDWIIDYNKSKVYTKRNANKIENVFANKITYYTRVEKEKLWIVLKEKSQTKYNLRDEVVSVGKVKVTSENICELQELLNKTEDWNTLELEVFSSKR